MRRLKLTFLTSLIILILVFFLGLLSLQLRNKKNDGSKSDISGNKTEYTKAEDVDAFLLSDNIQQEILPVNPYSRPGDKVSKVTAIVVHYVGNPGTTAEQNRSYFNNLAELKNAYASSHYVVGLQGEIIQCVPLDEIAYASNNRNYDTISIECCHQDADGRFTDDTYNSLVRLVAALCRTYGLNPETDVIRHYDVTGKLCPIYYVNNPDEWYAFKLSVKMRCKGYKMNIIELYNINNNIDVRTNLISLKDKLSKELSLTDLKQDINYNTEIFAKLLFDEDSKVRKNAALIIGMIDEPGLVKNLYESYEKENTLFVRSAYLRSLRKYDFSAYKDSLTERLNNLKKAEYEQSELKHIAEELQELKTMVGIKGEREAVSFRNPKEPVLIFLTCKKKWQIF